MRENLDRIDIIAIPARLGSVVEESLEGVKKLHRRKIVRRLGAVGGTLTAFVAAFLIFGFTNPALASEIPLLGGLFKQSSEKTVHISSNLQEYGLVQPVGVTAQTDDAELKLTATEAYSDGNMVQVGLMLETPEEFQSDYDFLEPDQYGDTCEASINGEKAILNGVGLFTEEDGVWISTVRMDVPESQQEAEKFEISLVLRDLQGKSNSSPESEDIPGEFRLEFDLTPDLAHNSRYQTEAEDNGAKLLDVSVTPAQIILTVEKPYWGEALENADLDEPDSHPAGFPHLYTADGREITQDARASAEKGGYDYNLREKQTADLYFDGAPAGEETVVLKFIKGDGQDRDRVLASFTIDLAAGTVTAGEK